jgi:hypothetical protein
MSKAVRASARPSFSGLSGFLRFLDSVCPEHSANTTCAKPLPTDRDGLQVLRDHVIAHRDLVRYCEFATKQLAGQLGRVENSTLAVANRDGIEADKLLIPVKDLKLPDPSAYTPVESHIDPTKFRHWTTTVRYLPVEAMAFVTLIQRRTNLIHLSGIVIRPDTFDELAQNNGVSSAEAAAAVGCLVNGSGFYDSLHASYKSLGDFLGELFERIQDNLDALSEPKAAPRKDVPEGVQVTTDNVMSDKSMANGTWFKSEPPADSKFKHGPISGKLKDLCDWTEIDRRTLRSNNGKTGWWIQKEHAQLFAVWFSSAGRLSQIKEKSKAG